MLTNRQNVLMSHASVSAGTAVGNAGRGVVEGGGRRTVPRSIGLALIVCAQFLVILDSSIVTVALPNIQHSLGFSQVGAQGVVTAYNTAFAGTLILGGRIADLFGRRRVFCIGMLGFAAGSLLCGLSIDPVMLICMRVLQGFGAAVIAPSALALLATTFPQGPARNRAMSIFGVATVMGFVGGLVLSGPLVDSLGWPGVFYAGVPVALAVAALTPRFLSTSASRRGRVDVPGALLITGGIALIVLAPGEGAVNGWMSLRFVVPLALGALLLAAFVLVEMCAAEPLVRLGFFRLREVRIANLVTLIAGALTGAGYLLLTMYLQDVLHYSPVQAGLAVAPTGVANLFLGLYVGQIVTRVGVRAAMTVATAGAGVFLALLAAELRVHQSFTILAIAVFPMGMFFLLTTVSATIGATTGVANAEQGLAGGLRQTSLQLGIALGVAVFVSAAASRTHSLFTGANPVSQSEAMVGGFRFAVAALAGLALLGSAVAVVGFRPRNAATVPNRSPDTGGSQR